MRLNKLSKVHWAWILFDNATIGFFTIVLIFVFGPYFVDKVAPSPAKGQEIWGFTIGLASFFVAIFSPILGAIADISGHKKKWIFLFSILVIPGLTFLYFLTPKQYDQVSFYMIALAIAFIGIRLATSFTNAMLPQIADRDQIGKLSGYGTAIGNLGGLVLIIIVLGFMVGEPESSLTLFGIEPVMGLDPSIYQGERASVLLSAIWYLIFIIPLFLFIPEYSSKKSVRVSISKGIIKLYRTTITILDRKNYFLFLIAVLFYRNGISTLFAFGGIYAVGVLNLSVLHTGIFGILAIIFGAFGGWLAGLLDQKFGSRKIILAALGVLILDCGFVVSSTRDTVLFGFFAVQQFTPLILYLIAGAIAGAASNAALSASRALLVHQIHEKEAAEAFGLYELASRITAFTGPLAVAFVTALTNSQAIGILPIIMLLAVGFLFLLMVND